MNVYFLTVMSFAFGGLVVSHTEDVLLALLACFSYQIFEADFEDDGGHLEQLCRVEN